MSCATIALLTRRRMKMASLLAWILIIMGVIIILIVQVVAAGIIYTEFGTPAGYSSWARSDFARYWFKPLLASAFVLCAAGTGMTGRTWRVRAAWAVLGLGLAAAVYFISGLVILSLYGV